MTTSTETRQSIPTGTWHLDPVHSSVGFEVDYMVGVFRGQFREVEASLVSRGDAQELEGSAAVASVDVKDENLSAHLQSPEFFDAERHPRLRFSSRAVERVGDRVTVDGTIEIKGTKQPVELTGTATDVVVDPYGKERIGLRLETAVDRTAFGLNWNTPLPSGDPALSNDVTLVADLAFVKEAQGS